MYFIKNDNSFLYIKKLSETQNIIWLFIYLFVYKKKRKIYN